MSQDIADGRTYEIVGPAVFYSGLVRVGPGGRVADVLDDHAGFGAIVPSWM
jgi:hypothetical protein